MTQLLIEVSDPIAEQLRRRAEVQGLTVSQYLVNLLSRELSEEWPPGFFEEVVGGWQGKPRWSVLRKGPMSIVSASDVPA
jgi:hypothetical protein